MKPSGQAASKRRAMNAKALSAFGLCPRQSQAGLCMRTIREGAGPTIFTIGYERRDGDELISLLLDAGVEMLVDIREKPISRKPDFRPAALQARCQVVGIDYEQMPELGSPENARKTLDETGDIEAFRRRFAAYVRKHLNTPLDHLTELAKARPVALLCYERCHEDCHRSIIADSVADRLKGGVVAII